MNKDKSKHISPSNVSECRGFISQCCIGPSLSEAVLADKWKGGRAQGEGWTHAGTQLRPGWCHQALTRFGARAVGENPERLRAPFWISFHIRNVPWLSDVTRVNAAFQPSPWAFPLFYLSADWNSLCIWWTDTAWAYDAPKPTNIALTIVKCLLLSSFMRVVLTWLLSNLVTVYI